MYKPSGVLHAMVTPMNSNETINEKELRAQVNRFVNSGDHGLFYLCTNGELYALDY